MPAIAPPWGTLNAIDLVNGDILWKVPLGEYPQLVAKGIRNTGTMNYGGAVATAGGLVFVAATPDEKIRAFEKHTGRVLWEHQLPCRRLCHAQRVHAQRHASTSTIAAGGSGKNAHQVGRFVDHLCVADEEETTAPSAAITGRRSAWIQLFDGKTLNGWVHMNGAHNFTVEDGAIVGRTVESSAAMNSFLCTLQEFDDFELELETYIDPVTNSGVQIRTKVRPVAGGGRGNEAWPDA